MLLKTNRKKQIFSKRKDIRKFSLDLDPEYVEKLQTIDEELDIDSGMHTHVILVKIPIDKVSAIKNKSMFIEGFACKDIAKLRSRSKLYTGFNANSANSLNFAIANKEMLARESFQQKMQNANLTKLFGVDITSTILASIKNADVIEKKKPYIDIFGYESQITVKSLSSSSNLKLKNINRSDLNHLSMRSSNKNIKNIRNFDIVTENRLKNLSKSAISSFNFKKEFNGYLMSGIDPAKIIARSSYSSQTLDQLAKGRLQRNFKTKEDLRDFANKFHKLVETTSPRSSSSFAIKKTKIVKVHETITVKIKISSRLLEDLGSKIFDVIVYAKDEERRILDYYVLKINLNRLINKKRLIQQSLDLKKHGMMCRRSSTNRATFKVINDTDSETTYNILQASYSNKGLRNKRFFDPVSKLSVAPKKSLYALRGKNGPILSKEKSYFYRTKIAQSEIKFDNTFFDSISAMKKNTSRTGSYVDIFCINDSTEQIIETQQSIKITIKNFPFSCIALNIVKRNLTKKEKEFKVIKNLNQLNTNLQKELNTSLLELKVQKTIFLSRKNTLNNLTFIDNDIEEGDVYEYKVLVYKDNCETEHSINSYEIKYEKRKSIMSVSLNSKNRISLDQMSSNSKATVTARFTVETQKNAIDDLFKVLDRNSYELFSKEFDDIKESLSENISCNVSLINTSTGNKTNLGNFAVNKKNKTITVKAEIDDMFSDYKLLVTPRIASTSYIVENILNKMEGLPSLQRSMPISTFLRTLQKQRNKNKAGSKNIVSSVPIDKYTGKSVRFFGLILDPVTKFNQEGDDFYFEGTTGDNFMFDIHKLDFLNQSSALKFSGFVDLTYLQRSHGNLGSYKKLSILKMKGNSSSSQLVDFYAIYAKSNGVLSFLGMISPERFGNHQYEFCADLDETVGITEILCATILKDGTFIRPTNITNLLCDTKKIEVI